MSRRQGTVAVRDESPTASSARGDDVEQGGAAIWDAEGATLLDRLLVRHLRHARGGLSRYESNRDVVDRR
jgi:hypothetical protein